MKGLLGRHLVQSPDKVGGLRRNWFDSLPSGWWATDKPRGPAGVSPRLRDLMRSSVSGAKVANCIGQISALLASGKNVVTPSYHALSPPSRRCPREQLGSGPSSGKGKQLLLAHRYGGLRDRHSAVPRQYERGPHGLSRNILCGAYRVPVRQRLLGFGRTENT